MFFSQKIISNSIFKGMLCYLNTLHEIKYSISVFPSQALWQTPNSELLGNAELSNFRQTGLVKKTSNALLRAKHEHMKTSLKHVIFLLTAYLNTACLFCLVLLFFLFFFFLNFENLKDIQYIFSAMRSNTKRQGWRGLTFSVAFSPPLGMNQEDHLSFSSWPSILYKSLHTYSTGFQNEDLSQGKWANTGYYSPLWYSAPHCKWSST